MFNQCPICYSETTLVYEMNGQNICPNCFTIEEFGGEGSGNFGHEGRPGEVGGSGGGGKEPAGGGVRNKQKSPSWAAEKGDWDQSKKDTEILGSFKSERQQEAYKKARKQGFTPNEAEDIVWSGRLGNDT